VFLPAPSTLCGSPVLTRGTSGLSALPSTMHFFNIVSVLTSTFPLWFQVLLADISGKVCQGGSFPKGYARF